MARTRFKWKCIFVSYIILFNVFSKSLPISKQMNSLSNTDTIFNEKETPIVTDAVGFTVGDTKASSKKVNFEVPVNADRALSRRSDIRPDQEVENSVIEITFNDDSFDGRIVLDIVLSRDTREDDIVLNVENLDVHSVRAGYTEANARDVGYNVDGNRLEIYPEMGALNYKVIIEYSGNYMGGGLGLHKGHYDQDTYVAMNLHPTYARRVFPCMDEPTEVSRMSFTFNGLEYTHLDTNSMLEENSGTQYRPLQGPPHLWGMIAHNLINVNIPIANVLLYGRPGLVNQDAQASVAINSYFTNLNEYTDKPYLEIIMDQDGRMNIFALPDVSTKWHALSTVGIWEPYIFMETVHSVKQRQVALVKIAEAMARQWLGYVVFPQNWRYEWIVEGLASYVGWEMFRRFQGDSFATDVTLLDVNTLFVTEVIQESLLLDAMRGVGVLEPEDYLYEENQIRDHVNVNGILNYKAPALMRMLRIVLGDADNDFMQSAVRSLLNRRALQTVNSLNFNDAVNSDWMGNNNGMIENFGEYIEPWIWNEGYPLVRVSLVRGSGVFLSQERFGFTGRSSVQYDVPITYTTSMELDFEGDKIYPVMMLSQTENLNLALGEEDWVLFNIQGQGYYRVTYDTDLWERIIEAMEDPERREEIHPLNRATLIDDALNLARGRIIEYDIAFRIVLTMVHETEYAPWKAFVRNMNFLRKRLVAYVDDDEDLDPDIYLRMVRRTIHAFENEIGFYPDASMAEPAMTTLTRGLVMDHACRSNYQPCIAAAVDWFYDPNNNGVVNPDIPREIRPAVYCTMVREGGEEVIEALNERLEIEPSHYERVVILESLACSQDEDYINQLLDQTIDPDGPFGVEERVKIFAAVAESSYANAGRAREFMHRRTSEIRNMYGGPEKLEEVIFILADNMADDGLSGDFRIWVESQHNNLDDSQDAAFRALERVDENLEWDRTDRDEVYEWIDENHAPTVVLSVMALSVSILVAMLIQ